MKVFQIGFGRCGTNSLCAFFSQNGYKSVHWGGAEHPKAKILAKNHKEGKLYCHGHDDIVFWSDIGYLQRNFQAFAEQYPEAKFIYNIRNLDNWIKSKEIHRRRQPNSHDIRQKKFFNLEPNEIPSKLFWKAHWVLHRNSINEYFDGKRACRLLVFDIEKDGGQKIADFLPELEFKNLSFPHKNATKDKFI